MKKTAYSLVLFTLVSMSVHSAYAFQMTPLYAFMEPTGRGRTTTFVLTNTTRQKVAVKLFMTDRLIDEKGKEKTPPIEGKKLFSVYPKQVILTPGKSRKVRVTWRGAKKLKKEQAFRLFAKQQPVKGLRNTVKSKVGSIEVVLQYIASVYVKPEGAYSQILPKEAKVIAAKNNAGPAKLSFVLHNEGTAHRVLDHVEMQVEYKDRQGNLALHKISKDEMNGVHETNMLAGHRRYFEVPWSVGHETVDETAPMKLKLVTIKD